MQGVVDLGSVRIGVSGAEKVDQSEAQRLLDTPDLRECKAAKGLRGPVCECAKDEVGQGRASFDEDDEAVDDGRDNVGNPVCKMKVL